MAKGNETPAELRGLEKLITTFTYQNGFEISRVFDDWLIYIITYFRYSTKPHPVPDWNYTSEQDAVFMEMMQEWINVMQSKTIKSGNSWYDAFGDIYETIICSSSRATNNGQFFTPAQMCNILTLMNVPDKSVTGKKVSDMCSGSGRTLLSFHAYNPGNFLFAEDIDRTCAMMCVCNFIIHGCVGEVVWHDSMNPESYFGGWRVNEHLSSTGYPGVSRIEKEQSHIIRFWNARKAEHEQSKTIEADLVNPAESIHVSEPVKVMRPTQLMLFD